MSGSYIQPYHNWFTPSWMTEARHYEIDQRVNDLLIDIDFGESEVYGDRDYTVAREMLANIGVKT